VFRRARSALHVLIAGAVLVVVGSPARAQAQPQAQPADTMAFYKALDLEAAGKYREAAPLFRVAIHTSAGINALLGLERVYAELGWGDSLLAPIDSLIASNPREETYRTVQLRTLETLGRDAQLRTSFDKWTRDLPTSPSPYREYARILLSKNRAVAADSVLMRARDVLGSSRDLQLEVAQARAAQGQWVESAQAWRLALRAQDYLVQAAAYALAPTPSSTRAQVREVFLEAPTEVPARRALAELEMSWGSPADGWNALRGLPPDSAAADAWAEFAQRAEAEERWPLAREALEAALRVERKPARRNRRDEFRRRRRRAAPRAALGCRDRLGEDRAVLPAAARARPRRARPSVRSGGAAEDLRPVSDAGRAQLARARDRLGVGAPRRHVPCTRRARHDRPRRRLERRRGLARAL
jgi:tetratricopeptide (TPR) repeat protein